MPITYEPLWQTMRDKNISTYQLIKSGFSKSKLDRLKHNRPCTTETIGELCGLLDCQPADILNYKE